MLRGTLTITVMVFLLTLAVSGLAAEVPKELLGTWSNNKSICDGDAGPDVADIYTFTPTHISS